MNSEILKFCQCSGVDSFIKNGFDSKGEQRWKCKYCGKAFSKRNLAKKLPTNMCYKPVSELTPFELYFLGFAMADGCIRKRAVQFTLAQKDKCQLEFFKKELQSPNKISEYYSNANDTWEVWINFRIAYYEEDMYHLGLMPRKTGKETFLPYMKSNYFIRGFFDGDGTIYSTGAKTVAGKWHDIHRGEFVCSNEQFMIDINNFIADQLNIKPKTVNRKRGGQTGNYFIRYQGKQLMQFCEWLYKDSDNLRLERKYKKYLEIKNRVET